MFVFSIRNHRGFMSVLKGLRFPGGVGLGPSAIREYVNIANLAGLHY